MKTNKIILGSGLEALLARDILGSNWRILSPGDFNQNTFIGEFILADERLDDYYKLFGGINKKYLYSAISANGHLLYNNMFLSNYYGRIYSSNQTINHMSVISDKFVNLCYSDLNVYRLYEKLLNKYLKEIKHFKDMILSDHKITVNGDTYEYNKIINTLPLSLFNKFGYNIPYKSYGVTILLCNFSNNIENDIVYVIDEYIPFHKVIKWNNIYAVFFKGKVDREPFIIHELLHDLKIFDLYYIDDYYHEFTMMDSIDDIYMIGRYARQDDAMSISDTVLNIMKFIE